MFYSCFQAGVQGQQWDSGPRVPILSFIQTRKQQDLHRRPDEAGHRVQEVLFHWNI